MSKKISFGLVSMALLFASFVMVGCDTGNNDTPDPTPAVKEPIVEPGPSVARLYLYDANKSGDGIVASAMDGWGTGTAFNMAFADANYNPCIESVAKGGWGNTVAWNTITAGTLTDYTTLYFKVKSADYTYIIIKFPKSGTAGDAGKQYFLADGTALKDGWTLMKVDLAKDFGDLAATPQAAFYWQAIPIVDGSTVPVNEKFYLADIYLTK